eukprot:TRINITY_DN8273_c0_g1_i13.p1 TRINITY_DN8273_c0_g1~~TRINITY_DN8273_c0_g1_i13.p1  ORF type:complete len:497 (-),score=15.05 TRINITY_DN8273_c0_g1_i13:18-1292(-)
MKKDSQGSNRSSASKSKSKESHLSQRKPFVPLSPPVDESGPYHFVFVLDTLLPSYPNLTFEFPRSPETRYIVISWSAPSDSIFRKKAFEAGFNAMISKPMRRINVVRALCVRERPSGSFEDDIDEEEISGTASDEEVVATERPQPTPRVAVVKDEFFPPRPPPSSPVPSDLIPPPVAPSPFNKWQTRRLEKVVSAMEEERSDEEDELFVGRRSKNFYSKLSRQATDPFNHSPTQLSHDVQLLSNPRKYSNDDHNYEKPRQYDPRIKRKASLKYNPSLTAPITDIKHYRSQPVTPHYAIPRRIDLNLNLTTPGTLITPGLTRLSMSTIASNDGSSSPDLGGTTLVKEGQSSLSTPKGMSHPHHLRLTRKSHSTPNLKLDPPNSHPQRGQTRLFSQKHARVMKRIKEIGRAVQQECRDRSRMPSSA